MKPETYFSTLSAALEQAQEYAESKGYQVDEEAIYINFGSGGVVYTETKRGSIPLWTENGNESRKCLQISIYRMESGTYELTCYIN